MLVCCDSVDAGFPVIKVLLRSRTLGSSANRLNNNLWEKQLDFSMRRAIQYLSVYQQFLALSNVRGQFPPHMSSLPSPIWLLTVYGYNVLMRLDENKAMIISTFGSILKIYSTMKVWEGFFSPVDSETAVWICA